MTAKPSVDMSVLDELYRAANMAIKVDDDSPVKEQMIEAAEDGLIDIMIEAEEVFKREIGEDWKKKVHVISSALCGMSLATQGDIFELEQIDTMTEKQQEVFFGVTKIVSQISFVAGMVLGLKAAGVWEDFKKFHLGDDHG